MKTLTILLILGAIGFAFCSPFSCTWTNGEDLYDISSLYNPDDDYHNKQVSMDNPMEWWINICGPLVGAACKNPDSAGCVVKSGTLDGKDNENEIYKIVNVLP